MEPSINWPPKFELQAPQPFPTSLEGLPGIPVLETDNVPLGEALLVKYADSRIVIYVGNGPEWPESGRPKPDIYPSDNDTLINLIVNNPKAFRFIDGLG